MTSACPRLLALVLGLALSAPALAQDPVPPPPADPNSGLPGTTTTTEVPALDAARKVNINFVDVDLLAMLKYFAGVTGRNFILGDPRELETKKVTIISNTKVSPFAAYEAFLSSLEIHGLTTVKVGSSYKIVKSGESGSTPLGIGRGGDIRSTDNFVTQIIQLDNVLVNDVRQVVDQLVSKDSKVIAYAPTNTLIITDSGNNLRRIYQIVSELDIAAPKSSLEIIPIVYAEASEIKVLIESLYGTAEDTATPAATARSSRASRRARRDETPAATGGVTAGKESKYISKVLSDERTNTLIVIADENGLKAVLELIAKVDIDVDPTSRSQIYVRRLEHAKAEDVAGVLNDLSQEASRNSNSRTTGNPNARTAAARARETAAAAASEESSSGAIAAFESGMRIAHDQNTNSLVIIASKDDYQVVSSVIDQLDIQRKQVFVDCVIMELSSNDTSEFNLAIHGPADMGNGVSGAVTSQFGTNSLGFPIDAANGTTLTGLAFGVFGQAIDVPISSAAGASTITVPAFGIALHALKTNQNVNIVSNPNLLTLDNEEAKLVVGRRVPFPTSSGLNSLGQPVNTFQREDVAMTLEVTPRINSSDQVTLELRIEVSEIEDGSATNNQGGPTTSKREVETVALVGDNQTLMLSGLVGSTDTEAESKIPILGDLPLIGALFRNRSKSTRRTDLRIFLTPHIIDDHEDMLEIMRVKSAQRQEYLRRFHGRSQDKQLEEMERLLQYSMNQVDQPSVFRGPSSVASTVMLDGEPISDEAREDLSRALEDARVTVPGDNAGSLPGTDVLVDPIEAPEPAEGE